MVAPRWAVTILTALWYGWEHSAIQTLGMLDWLPRLYYFLPILAGDDGPFRLCSPASGDLPARHEMSLVAEVVPAPPGWWQWWGTDVAAERTVLADDISRAVVMTPDAS